MGSFDIHAPAGAVTKKKRLGRGMGSGKGGTSGKGNKGQKARSGGGVRLGFEGGQTPLFRRLPRRGFSNAVFKIEYVVINLNRLDEFYSNGETVSYETLVAKNLIKASEAAVKILGQGELSKKLKVEGLKLSASARAAIEKAGGTVVDGSSKKE